MSHINSGPKSKQSFEGTQISGHIMNTTRKTKKATKTLKAKIQKPIKRKSKDGRRFSENRPTGLHPVKSMGQWVPQLRRISAGSAGKASAWCRSSEPEPGDRGDGVRQRSGYVASLGGGGETQYLYIYIYIYIYIYVYIRRLIRLYRYKCIYTYIL